MKTVRTKTLYGKCYQNWGYYTPWNSWLIGFSLFFLKVELFDKGFIVTSLHVSSLHLHRCVPVDMTPSSCVCCGTPHAPAPCAAQSAGKTRHARTVISRCKMQRFISCELDEKFIFGNSDDCRNVPVLKLKHNSSFILKNLLTWLVCNLVRTVNIVSINQHNRVSAMSMADEVQFHAGIWFVAALSE